MQVYNRNDPNGYDCITYFLLRHVYQNRLVQQEPFAEVEVLYSFNIAQGQQQSDFRCAAGPRLLLGHQNSRLQPGTSSSASFWAGLRARMYEAVCLGSCCLVQTSRQPLPAWRGTDALHTTRQAVC